MHSEGGGRNGSGEEENIWMNLVIVVPPRTNGRGRDRREEVRGGRPGVGFGVFDVGVAKSHEGASGMVFACEGVGVETIGMILVAIVIDGWIVIGNGDHFAREEDGGLRSALHHR